MKIGQVVAIKENLHAKKALPGNATLLIKY